METERELLFIREAQKTFSDVRSYWIGGFTDFDPGSIIHYSTYYSLGSGNQYLIIILDFCINWLLMGVASLLVYFKANS